MSTSAPASEAELVGQVLGNWRIVRPLARGGFGVVYEAHHIALAGHRAAVKVLHSLYAGDPEVQRRFTSEANAASRIAHPNIVKIFDAGTTAQGTCFIAMEFLDGQPLSALIKQGSLAARRVAHILAQVASAVGAAHTRGIIHREQYALSRNAVLGFQKLKTAMGLRWKEFAGVAELPSVTNPHRIIAPTLL